MVAAFPLAKLGVLLVKQISKPLANSIASRARSSRIFRDYVCIPVAQLFHWADVKVRMRILNLGKVSKVPKLDEKKAIDTGSQLLSEFIILSIATVLIIFEYRRQSEKEEAKNAVIEKEKSDLREQVNNIAYAVEEQAAQIRELSRITMALRDDLERANRKNSGFLGLGSGSKGTQTPQEVAFNHSSIQHAQNPILSAVIQMSLHSV